MELQKVNLLAVIGLNFIFLSSCQDVRSTSFDIGDQIKIEYAVLWGWGMEQRLTTSRRGIEISEVTEEVRKRPYNAGGPIFASKDKKKYYVVLFGGVYRIDTGTLQIDNICHFDISMLENLEYAGRFSLTSDQSSPRGSGVAFTPKGKNAPQVTGVGADHPDLEGRCG